MLVADPTAAVARSSARAGSHKQVRLTCGAPPAAALQEFNHGPPVVSHGTPASRRVNVSLRIHLLSSPTGAKREVFPDCASIKPERIGKLLRQMFDEMQIVSYIEPSPLSRPNKRG